ncbi:hypothetical protein CVT25_007852 [Psilocybe cyanescens]|uniref:Uncharacterized protein n=1 Tax=Psilocybe cyanescens TaxID=93625 RepID=A0A409XJI7_PSICY|nr:hypothetical protein CVT25_007852 [Psilocybe cyanescens]
MITARFKRGVKGERDERYRWWAGKTPNAAIQTVPLQQELVQDDHSERGDEKLNDEQEADSGSEVGQLAVQPCDPVDRGLAKGNVESEE